MQGNNQFKNKMRTLRGENDSKMKYKWCCQCGEVNEGIDEYVKHIEYHDSAEKEIKTEYKRRR